MDIIIYSIIVLGLAGLAAAVVLWGAAKRFHVEENPKIARIESLLPGANCGGCGLTGCHAFAQACSQATSLDDLHCTGIDSSTYALIAEITGLNPGKGLKRKARVKCSATCERRTNNSSGYDATYQGVRSCAMENILYAGESNCTYGCLGCGDCVRECTFDAIYIHQPGDMPRVDFTKCTGCGKCARGCPRGIIEIVNYDACKPMVTVACSNHDKGPIASKECDVSCIGCGLCARKCTHEAVSVNNFLATVDSTKCVGCLDCVNACPRHIISFTDPNSTDDD